MADFALPLVAIKRFVTSLTLSLLNLPKQKQAVCETMQHMHPLPAVACTHLHAVVGADGVTLVEHKASGPELGEFFLHQRLFSSMC